MTRILTIGLPALILAALTCGCGNSSGSGTKQTARPDVEPGSSEVPGSKLTTAPGSADPTGGKKAKGAEDGSKKEGG